MTIVTNCGKEYSEIAHRYNPIRKYLKIGWPTCPRCGANPCYICNNFQWIVQYECAHCELRFLYVQYEPEIVA